MPIKRKEGADTGIETKKGRRGVRNESRVSKQERGRREKK